MASRDRNKNRSEKTDCMNRTADLVEYLLRKLCKEDIFPKRSRWLFSGKIADLLNDFETYVNLANEIKPVTQEERDKRHFYLTMAVATLKAMDAKVNTAQRVLCISPEKLGNYADIVNDLGNLLTGWMKYDDKKYGKPSGFSDKG